jgi:hypothetical protein
MVIYLTHPLHGAKVATIEAEAEADEKNGWTRYNPDTPSAPEEAANTLVTKRKYTRKGENEGV